MTVLDAPAKPGSLRPRSEVALRRRAEAILARFAAAFPDIAYDILWDTDTVNAQAFRRGERKCVRVYGGLIRHRAIGIEGLALAIAHETGHHEGGEPKDRHYEWLTCDAQADHWAAAVGMRKVFAREQADRWTRLGARQIVALLTSGFGDTPLPGTRQRYRLFIDGMRLRS